MHYIYKVIRKDGLNSCEKKKLLYYKLEVMKQNRHLLFCMDVKAEIFVKKTNIIQKVSKCGFGEGKKENKLDPTEVQRISKKERRSSNTKSKNLQLLDELSENRKFTEKEYEVRRSFTHKRH